MSKKSLTVTEAANYSRLDREKIYELIKAKKLRVVKVGNSYRVPQDELDRYLEVLDRESIGMEYVNPVEEEVSVNRGTGKTMKYLLSVTEANEYTGLGRDNIYALLRSGRLKAIKIGRSNKIHRLELEKYLDRVAKEGADLFDID